MALLWVCVHSASFASWGFLFVFLFCGVFHLAFTVSMTLNKTNISYFLNYAICLYFDRQFELGVTVQTSKHSTK